VAQFRLDDGAAAAPAQAPVHAAHAPAHALPRPAGERRGSSVARREPALAATDEDDWKEF
jgi:hypothetical protein